MIDQSKLFFWIPEPDRNKLLSNLEGYSLIRYPAGYQRYLPERGNVRWMVAFPLDEEGYVVKVGPVGLVSAFAERLDEKLQPGYTYEIGYLDSSWS